MEKRPANREYGHISRSRVAVTYKYNSLAETSSHQVRVSSLKLQLWQFEGLRFV